MDLRTDSEQTMAYFTHFPDPCWSPWRYVASSQTAGVHVHPPVPDRFAAVGNGVSLMFGCYNMKLNVCRQHGLREDKRQPFEQAVHLLKAWANSLEAEKQKSCTELVALLGSDGADDPSESREVMLIELLVFCKLSPKMQFFANCCVVEGDGAMRARDGAMVDEFPFKVEVRSRVPRLSCERDDGAGDHRTVCSSTSDELALYMVGLKKVWQLAPLNYDVDVEHRGLGRMVVTSRGEVFSGGPKKQLPKKNTSRLGNLPAEFELGDPMEYGRAHAQSSSSGGGQGHAADAGGAGAAQQEEADGFASDLDELADVPGDVIDDMYNAVAAAHGVVLGEGSGDAAALEEEDEEEGEENAEEEQGEMEDDDFVQAAASSGDEADSTPACDEAREDSGGDSADRGLTPEQAAVVDEWGYVTSPVAPFDARGWVGRLTVYPEGSPLDKQNVSMRCCLHTGCSVVRGRTKMTNERLIRWLFSGVPITAENRHDETAIRRAHYVAGVAMC